MPPILPSWAALAIGAAAVTLWYYERGAEPVFVVLPSLTTQSSTGASEEVVVPSLPVPTAEQRTEIVLNALFSPSRTPERYVPPEPEPEPEFEEYVEEEPIFEEPEPEPLPPPEPPLLRMLGYIRDDAGERALLNDPNDASERWFSLGDQIKGWTVTGMTASEVTLTQNGSTFIVKLYE
ncbi:MAG: hypothetical protein ABJH45_02590 [Paracoccaceae bacterium]